MGRRPRRPAGTSAEAAPKANSDTAQPSWPRSAAATPRTIRQPEPERASTPSSSWAPSSTPPANASAPNAVHTLQALVPLGLPIGLLAADRAYTDQTTEHFQLHVRQLGYQLALDYKQDQRGVQGSHLGAVLVDGTLACPLLPEALANATTGLDDKTVRDPNERLRQRLAAREPYFLKRKQGPDRHGTVRLQCPAAGSSPSVTRPRFNRVHRPQAGPPAVVDLTSARSTTAHLAAKPSVQIAPAERLRPPAARDLPRICRKPTITVRPGDLGKIDKLRQDRPYLGPAWHDAYKPMRAHNEAVALSVRTGSGCTPVWEAGNTRGDSKCSRVLTA
ncbi:hypothetical protein ABT238_38650, partial [Kitasatospora sp. NPDC001527]